MPGPPLHFRHSYLRVSCLTDCSCSTNRPRLTRDYLDQAFDSDSDFQEEYFRIQVQKFKNLNYVYLRMERFPSFLAFISFFFFFFFNYIHEQINVV